MDNKSQHQQFIRLFLEIQPQIYGYLRTMIFNRTDAEDVLQDVASVLWKKFDEFQPGHSSIIGLHDSLQSGEVLSPEAATRPAHIQRGCAGSHR